MEPLFENKYTMTKAVLREFYWKAGHYLIICILSCIAILCGALIAAFDDQPGRFFLLIWVLVFTALMVLLFFIMVNLTYKRMAEQAPCKPFQAYYSFYDDKIIGGFVDSETRTSLDYSTVKKTIVSKNLIILKTRANVGYILRRDSFTLGTEEAFMAFINGKISENKAKK